MDVTIQGTVISSRPEGGTSAQGKAWQKQVLLIQTTEQQNNVYEVDCFQDAMIQAQTVGVGMPVTVVAKVKSRQGKPNPQTGAIRYFLGLSAKTIQGAGMPMGQPMHQPQYAAPQQQYAAPQQPVQQQYHQAAPMPTHATPPPPQPQYQAPVQQPQQQFTPPPPITAPPAAAPVAAPQQPMTTQQMAQDAMNSMGQANVTTPGGQPVAQTPPPMTPPPTQVPVQGQLPLGGNADDDLPF
jgi:hypothetical protein